MFKLSGFFCNLYQSPSREGATIEKSLTKPCSLNAEEWAAGAAR